MGEESLLSRSGVTDAEGKLTEKLQVPVSEEFEEKLIALAILAGKPKAEYARILLIKSVEGEFAYLRMMGVMPRSGEDRKVV